MSLLEPSSGAKGELLVPNHGAKGKSLAPSSGAKEAPSSGAKDGLLAPSPAPMWHWKVRHLLGKRKVKGSCEAAA